LAGRFVEAREIHRRYHALMEINFVESNPGPVKAAMAEMGLLEPAWRLPLVGPQVTNGARIRAVLENLNLLGNVRDQTIAGERIAVERVNVAHAN
jgi:4-hydroxy-tetrahydrodipicolinate synthase